MDKRKYNGGARQGAGRPTKADELKLIERLDNIINKDSAIELLKELMKSGDIRALKLYLQYRYGQPKNNIEISSINEQPLFTITNI